MELDQYFFVFMFHQIHSKTRYLQIIMVDCHKIYKDLKNITRQGKRQQKRKKEKDTKPPREQGTQTVTPPRTTV